MSRFYGSVCIWGMCCLHIPEVMPMQLCTCHAACGIVCNSIAYVQLLCHCDMHCAYGFLKPFYEYLYNCSLLS